MRFFSILCIVVVFINLNIANAYDSLLAESEVQTIKKPNIVLIVADDLGFSDLRSYGSEINTPNLDYLAQNGVRFSNYHTAASCAPTRAMLLSGVDSHRAGVANIEEALTSAQSHSPFYRGTLNHNVVTIASLLKDNGYHTYMSGKWHLGYKDLFHRPINRGFEQTIMMPYSGGDNWSDKSYLPNYSKVDWYANGQITHLPDDFYSSKFIIDQSIEFIDMNKKDQQPFFSYVAFQAVHIPVQAPKAFTEKYINTYKEGWNALREKRQKSVKRLGLLPEDANMITMTELDGWEDLDQKEKKYHAKSMAVYAGMVDAMDHHIGRLIQYLKDIGEYENTVFIFTSDNGAEASDPVAVARLFHLWMKYEGYNTDYETLGEKESYNYIGPNFASAAVSPLGHYKFYSGEGGLRVPLIVSGPNVHKKLKGNIANTFAYVKDIAPTILQLTNTPIPSSPFKGKNIETITGKSLVPVINENYNLIHEANEAIAYEIGGNAALFQGDYKIMFNRPPLGDGKWHLYNIKKDPGETVDLRVNKPALFLEMKLAYEVYVETNGVLPIPQEYDQRSQVIKNAINERIWKPIANFFDEIL